MTSEIKDSDSPKIVVDYLIQKQEALAKQLAATPFEKVLASFIMSIGEAMLIFGITPQVALGKKYRMSIVDIMEKQGLGKELVEHYMFGKEYKKLRSAIFRKRMYKKDGKFGKTHTMKLKD